MKPLEFWGPAVLAGIAIILVHGFGSRLKVAA
jgi:hypothetical protein